MDGEAARAKELLLELHALWPSSVTDPRYAEKALRPLVRELVEVQRIRGAPVERVIVQLKDMIAIAAPGIGRNHGAQELAEHVVRWCIDWYFRDDVGTPGTRR